MKKIITRRGFTLMELLVVVLIIGILAAVAVPQYKKAVEKSKVMRDFTLLRSLADARRLYELENGTVNCNLEALSIGVPFVKKTPSSTAPYGCPDDETIAYTLPSNSTVQLGHGSNMLVYRRSNGYTIDYYTHAYVYSSHGVTKQSRGYCYVIGENETAKRACQAITHQEGEERNGRHYYYIY
ncbi:MAG: type II secretion system protein [Elusimicrobiaceae bacterium]|nr:type II secretion system protein [Elusimicrobiaceae bacterium]